MDLPAAAPLLRTLLNLPVEVSLQFLGFLDRQTLGGAMLANRRLGGIVNRHRKMLNLPEIYVPPVPPRLSNVLKVLAFLSGVALLLLPGGISYARFSTRSRLVAAGLVQESYHASDIRREGYQWHWAVWSTLLLALLEVAAAVKLLQRERSIADAFIDATYGPLADAFMDATYGPRRDRILKKHENLRTVVVHAIVAAFIFVGLFGSAAFYGTTSQTFPFVDESFVILSMMSTVFLVYLILFIVCTAMMLLH